MRSNKSKGAKGGSKKSKNKKNKFHLVFDENKRREFLTGFHKRKLQRKKDAKEKFDKDLKEERKRIKAEAKESYKKLIVSYKPIPELENLLTEKHEDDDVTVKVVELSTSEIANQNNWIGTNQPKYEDVDGDDESDESKHENEVPGMELKRKPILSKKKQEIVKKFESEKDVKKILKKEATKNVKNSKVFQMKNKMERQKQRKKSMHLKKERLKIRDKKGRKNNKKGKGGRTETN